MPIRKDNSDLPIASKSGGNPPVQNPIVVPLVAQTWHREYIEAGNDTLPMAIPGRRFRASWAAKRCDRSLQYALQRTQATEPPTLADHWRFGIGTMVHEIVQKTLPTAFPNADIEAPVDLLPVGIDGAATVDVIIRDEDGKPLRVVEIKTINGFGFKKSATAFKGPADGPRWSAVVQGALAASALGARDGLVVAYLSLENLSPNMSTYADGDVGRFAAEWHYTLDECDDIANAEAIRIGRVLAFVDNDGLAPRTIHDPELPDGATVTNPDRGMWTVTIDGQVHGAGSTWMCGYCDHRSRCAFDGPGGTMPGSDDAF